MLDWIFNKSCGPNEYTLFYRFIDMFNKDDYPMLICDSSGSLIYTNTSALELYGYYNKVLNDDICNFLNDSICLKHIRSLKKSIKETLEEQFYVVDFAVDGSRINIEAHAYNINLNNKSYIFSKIKNESVHRCKELIFEKPIKDRDVVLQAAESVMSMIEFKDPGTSGHQRNVADLSRHIADEIGLQSDRSFILNIASLLHDIGKLYVPSGILTKSGKLDDMEFSLMKKHCESGYGVLTQIGIPEPICEVILQHHERMDGSGYPNGLCSGDISMESRILGVADVFNAMVSSRPYRPRYAIEEAIGEIYCNRGILYDKDVVDACIGIISRKNYSFSSDARTGHQADRFSMHLPFTKSRNAFSKV